MAKTEYQALRESQTRGNMGECWECGGIYNLYDACPFCCAEAKHETEETLTLDLDPDVLGDHGNGNRGQ